MSLTKKRRASWLTTLFGIIAAAGLGMTHFAKDNPNGNLGDIGSVLAAIGALGTGMSAQDSPNNRDQRSGD